MNTSELVDQLLAAVTKARHVALRFAKNHNLRDPEFVDMAMQETAMRILSGEAGTFDPSLGTPEAYVAGIVYKVCVWLLKTYYRRPGLADGYDLGTDDWNPLAAAIRREEISLAGQAILRLPPHLRVAARRWPNTARRTTSEAKTPKKSTDYVHYFRAKERFLRELINIRSARSLPPP